MSETTARHGLPYIMSGQAQKHVTHNEALRVLDAVLQASVKSRSVQAPPDTPQESDFYLIGPDAAGGFGGYEDHLAGFIDGAWMYISPVQGLIVNVEDEAISLIYRGAAWEAFGAAADIDTGALAFPVLGINADADAVNRFLLSAPASLFNHEGAGHQLKINKANEGDTASIVFQTNFSGRAEMGLAGADNFSFKVSANGSDWSDALVINKATGEVSFPASRRLSRPVLFNMFADGGRFGSQPEPLDVRMTKAFSVPSYLNEFNDAVFTAGDKYIDNSSSFGGSRIAMPAHLEDLARKMRPGAPDSVLKLGTEFHTLSVTAGSGQQGSLSLNGTTAYLAVSSTRFPLPLSFTLSYWVRPTAGQCFIGTHPQMRLFIDAVEADSATELPFDTWTHITRIAEFSPGSYVGYETSPYRIFLTPGGAVDFAAPALFPGALMPDPAAPLGVINSLSAFLV